jgi:hypothetical protein
MRYLFIAASLLLASCTTPRSFTAELKPTSLKANNLEETLTRADEVMLVYSLVSYDAQDKPISVVNGSWGVQPIKAGQQANLANAQVVRLPMPKQGRIVASMILVEVDDYQKANELVGKIQRVNGLVSVPVGLLLSGAEAMTPLKYVTAGLTAAGVGLQVAGKFDTDDVLGQSSVATSAKRAMHVPARFTGSHQRDRYDYELSYDLLLKTVKIEPTGKE